MSERPEHTNSVLRGQIGGCAVIGRVGGATDPSGRVTVRLLNACCVNHVYPWTHVVKQREVEAQVRDVPYEK